MKTNINELEITEIVEGLKKQGQFELAETVEKMLRADMEK